MKKRSIFILMLLMTMVLAACSLDSPGSGNGNDADGDSGDSEGDKRIGFSISTLNNPFFVTLAQGAEEKAEELGMDITVVDAQDDPAKQASDIEDLIQQDVDLILINPTDSSAISAAIQSANSANIPVVTVDRSAEGGEVVAHIASDNAEGGRMAGEFIVEELGGEGKVVELAGISGSSAARERGQGFNEAIDESDLEVVANQTANFDRAEGLRVMENIIQSGVEFDAVFAHNDEMALGAREALDSAGMSDVLVVGFDATDDAVAAVENGNMAATVAQKPDEIGMSSVETAQSILDGDSVEEFVPVELELVTE
ncbi:ribose ABC transporter substrate-binding protein RbsB [Jeotgalibacillus proteolyticus]|uniref:Ribose ABC transporter substrate-binding protein RbsB n=1 Tax=Jeotgalibacillus proteolyticus TaxID=2082395 RepID=A0A2S5G8M6_9BACL|nr:ribose ABC transporter substrate-binding protein RbsB [Jeotgalibacillus proteolyticus]PPA69350.1 ribose ABC transporter substrate-binding protein RbsB [Jeotgalibacillus proteolyticus]